ncbi:MAG TPA: transglycosylase domain-containing protein [Acidimicrobiales bacterium]|nr:transglycosylase domain-containing protein [Acidimicrobiales bacterium]
MTASLKLLVCLLATAVFVAAGAVALTPAVESFAEGGSSVEEELFLSPLDQRSLVYDRNGGLIASLYGELNRAPVALSAIPEHVRDAVIVVEDAEFYSHDGVNLRATVRALFENVASGGIEQGGSTITMQVVKNSILTNEQTLERKTREAILARRLEEVFTKDQILERYLNTAYFGNGAYGVQAAAETYWGVDVGQLDWAQAALLAALIRNPSGYNPIRFPERAAQRRQLVYDRLVETGHLTQEQADLLAFAPLPTQVQRTTPPPDDYFVEPVKQLLLDDARFNIGGTAEERYNAVFSGGLRITTTFDPFMQQAALQARDDVLPGDAPGEFAFNCPSSSGGVCEAGQPVQGTAVVVTTDVTSGAVRAMVGGPGFDDYRFNIATQSERQAGSAFKTFVLAAALESGIVPDDTVSGNAPCRIPNPGGIPDPYIASNYGESRGGGGNITSQTSRSSNCAFVRLGQIVGNQRVIEVARRMGITTPLEPVPSLPLGFAGVRPIEMAAAYASLANDGIYNAPYYIESITDADGVVLYQHTPDSRRAVSRQTARLATEVLATNVRSGTGTRARNSFQPAAGKTGTAQQARDIWFVGFTPQYATAVWIGATSNEIPLRIGSDGSPTGGEWSARIWGQYMNAILDGSARAEFLEPQDTRRGHALRMPGEQATRPRPRPGGSGGGGGTATTAPPVTQAPAPTEPPPPATDPPSD